MGFVWPFKEYHLEDFDSVVIPLGQAQRAASVVAENQRRTAARTPAEEEREAEKASDSDNGKDSDSDNAVATIEALRAEIDADVSASGHDSAYDRKSKVVNKALIDIGMGRYQWELFVLCGFGWFADNLWLQTVALTLPSLSAEFGVSETNVRFTTLSLFLGLCIGAFFWGISADVIGRRPAFNLTLLLTGIFGVAVGAASSWISACGLYAGLGCGIGGNLPVDGTILSEALPMTSSNLLTLLSIFWPFGQLYSSLVGWAFLTSYAGNNGWRYLNYTMGATTLSMFLCHFMLFHLFESPKFLLSKGRQREAIMVIRAIAYHNGKKTWISEEILDEIGGISVLAKEEAQSSMETIKRSLGKFSTQRIKPLFAYKRLAINTTLLWIIWAAIGMAYPLFNAFIVQYLQAADPNAPPIPDNVLYRNYAIQSIRRMPWQCHRCIYCPTEMFFLFLFTTSTDATFQLGFSCMVALFQNQAYGTLYAYSPETFPSPNRSTGTGIGSGLNRFAGFCAPLVAIYSVSDTSASAKVPMYVSSALFLVCLMATACLPIETAGKQLI
ncbi:hypothetical protein OHC33_003095 [Knufia fluminis]|uniref:Major facilitator superfamily (MFS) profile domain-containing protein n=1 Tax=Knufia fluminis TaxID=191047 RepID=A0AAN8I5G7_9EURO|nr:hypothetical protein OHC33_003095 [Knufia fluminis]